MLKRNISKTLDTHHNSKIKDFHSEQNALESKQQELNVINDKLADISKSALSNLSETEFQNYINLTDKRLLVEQELTDIKKNTHEVDYYINTADLIFKYYDIVENGNILENETNATITENSILKFFKTNNDDDPEESIIKDDDRASLLDKYMQFTDYNYFKLNHSEESDTCPVCDSKTRTLLVNDGLMYCNDCHTIETIIIDHEKPSYKDPPKEIISIWSQQLTLVVLITTTFLNC
jgi:hypothetical protein